MREWLTRVPRWKKHVSKRYIKFIDTYIENGYSLEETAKAFTYTIGDMSSIFSRIEKELETIETHYSFADVPPQKRTELCEIVNWCDSHPQLIEKNMPEGLKRELQMLLLYRNVTKAEEALGMKQGILLSKILGRNKPRKPYEKGVYGYLPIQKPAN
jgi:predicted DNA-binding protein YlxM (UPF0122 family)